MADIIRISGEKLFYFLLSLLGVVIVGALSLICLIAELIPICLIVTGVICLLVHFHYLKGF
jgi:hypothetical protein